MNLLAHFALSGTKEAELTVGNFLGDFVKGKKYELYPTAIRRGILLHRAIDSYTDEHPVVLNSKRRLYSRHHHYSAVLVDIFYDHFLAVNFQRLTGQSLPEFATDVYALLQQHKTILPEKAQFMFPYMKRDNWLVNYRKMEGISRACKGIARRSPYATTMETGAESLQDHYSLFEEDFMHFWPEIQEYVQNWLKSHQEN